MNAQTNWRLTAPGAPPLSALKHEGGSVDGVERWASIAGGAALVALGLRRRNAGGLLAGLAGAALLGRGLTGQCPAKAALESTPSEQKIAEEQGWKSAAAVNQAQTINRPRAEVYAYFRDFNNLTRVMENIERIDIRDDTHSHWVVKAPAGRTVEWDSIVTADDKDRRIGWKSGEDADIRNAGSVEFRDAPGGRGTEVHVMIAFQPPGGMVGRTIAALFQKDPAIQLRRDLKRFKSMLETGELATSKAPDAAPRA